MAELKVESNVQPPALSLCMIVKNEAENLGRCLRSVQGVADEVIVVDTGSTDRTVEIAEAFGARVFHHRWQSDFSLARNMGLEQATGQWILILDADEELAEEARPRVKAVLAETAADGLQVHVRNLNAPGGILAYFDSMQLRLFRKRLDYRYEHPVHEMIVHCIFRNGGRLAATDLMIWHYGYMQKEVQGGESRARRNLKLLEQAVAESPQDPGQCARLGFSYYALGNYPLAYTYLRRALVELDASHFTHQFMETVLWTLWNVALIQHDTALAVYCVEAMRALNAEAPLSVRTLYMSARTGRVEGGRCLQLALAETAALPESLAHLRQAQRLLQQADGDYEQLSRLPEVAKSFMEKISADWHDCRRRLAEVADYLTVAQRQQAASAALDELLAADDIFSALDGLGTKLTPDLLTLTRLKAKVAQAEANPAVAEGFATLADLLEEKLGVSVVSEAAE